MLVPPLSVLWPLSLTVARAHDEPAWPVVKVKLACPLEPVVPVPVVRCPTWGSSLRTRPE